MNIKQDFFTLMGGRIKLRHSHYNPTSDAVWLAAFAPHDVTSVLDVGIGTGGVALCLYANNPDFQITGLDTSQQMLDVCADNCALNNLRPELINADILSWRTNRTFDLVITNPPYFHGTPAHHNAHHNADLPSWIARCIARVRPNGTFCIISDATTTATVISAMSKKLGNIQIIPLFGGKDTAERVLISGKLGSHAGTTLYHGFPMNYEPVLRDGLTIADILSRLSKKC